MHETGRNVVVPTALSCVNIAAIERRTDSRRLLPRREWKSPIGRRSPVEIRSRVAVDRRRGHIDSFQCEHVANRPL